MSFHFTSRGSLAVAFSCGAVALAAITSTAHAVPAFGLTDNNQIVRFDTATPGTIVSGSMLRDAANTPIPDLIGIDYRPATGQLYGVSALGVIYTINPNTAVATPGATLSTPLNGSRFGFDFNPVPDRLRIVSNADQNLRVNVDTGAAIIDGTLTYAAADVNAAQNPNVIAAAYTNNDNNVATGTTLYVLDSVLNSLAIQNPPNDGTLNTVGPIGLDLSSLAGFDIYTDAVGNNTGYAVMQNATQGISRLYTIDLATGTSTLVGTVGGGDLLDGLAIGVVPEPTTLAMGAGAALLVLRRRSW
jgi:hypothetical protein